jgi:hypothetical protein
MSRNRLILTGLIGLGGAVILTALCLFLIVWDIIPVLVNNPIFAWGLFLFLLAFSVAEIPVMIFGIRRIATGANPRAKYVALLVIAGYSFFCRSLCGSLHFVNRLVGFRMALAALSLIRFMTALVYL